MLQNQSQKEKKHNWGIYLIHFSWVVWETPVNEWIDIKLCEVTVTEYAQWLSGVWKIQEHVIFEILLGIQEEMSSR